MLRIGIDGRTLVGKLAGTGRYVFELCKALDPSINNSIFFVYAPSEPNKPVQSERWIYRIDNKLISKYLKPVAWVKTRLGSLCKQDNLDIFWGGAHFLPSLPNHIKKVLTVHDLVYLQCSHTMTFTHRLAHHLFFQKDIRSADIIFSNSKATSNRLFQFLGRKADAVIYPGVDQNWIENSSIISNECKNSFNISFPYLLAVGTLEPRKNLELLIKVFSKLKDNRQLKKDLNLLLVGGRGWRDKRLKKILSNLNRHDIIPLGYTEDKYLPALYSGCEAFIFPSLYEGFGIPVLEARACGAKILTTDIPELREAGGEDAIYVHPASEELAKGILSVLEMEKRPSTEKLYTWDQGAQIFSKHIFGLH